VEVGQCEMAVGGLDGGTGFVGVAGWSRGGARRGRTVMSERSLLVVGAGRLGLRVGQLWKQGRVVAETRSDKRHEELRKAGLSPRVRGEGRDEKFDYVAITMSPSGNDDYAGEVQSACGLWNGSGNLVFTSSGGVYGTDVDTVTVEDSKTHDTGERVQRLLSAEQRVLDSGGCVVRLAGLYDRFVGAHNIWLNMKEVAGRPDALVNLVHYDDAATLVLKALEADGAKVAGKVLLAADCVPISRYEICEAAKRDPAYAEKDIPDFTSNEGPRGKRYDNSYTRELLHWKPMHVSFAEYMAKQR